jgi:hypothetical protein
MTGVGTIVPKEVEMASSADAREEQDSLIPFSSTPTSYLEKEDRLPVTIGYGNDEDETTLRFSWARLFKFAGEICLPEYVSLCVQGAIWSRNTLRVSNVDVHVLGMHSP